MIDKEKTINELKKYRWEVLNPLADIIGDAIAVLGREKDIIRCKDCKYWDGNNSGYYNIGCKWREDESPDPDDYCSAGERKDAEG